MANPAHMNERLAAICSAPPNTTLGAPPFTPPCNNHVHGQVTNLHQSRSPNENLYSSTVFGQGNPRNYAPLSYTNGYAAIGDSVGATIASPECDPDRPFTFDGRAGAPWLPSGTKGLVD